MMWFKERMSSFVDRGNRLIAEGKTKAAMELLARGLEHYSNKVIVAVSPYAKSDAGLIVLVLRHIADEVEKDNPGAKELAEGLSGAVKKPELRETEKVKKPNKR